MNMQAIMAQAQKMQRDVMKKKEEVDNKEFIGKSEWVEAVVMGNKTVKEIRIIKEGTIDDEDREVLQDMLVIAINDAMAQIDKEMEKAMGPYGNALNGLF